MILLIVTEKANVFLLLIIEFGKHFRTVGFDIVLSKRVSRFLRANFFGNYPMEICALQNSQQ